MFNCRMLDIVQGSLQTTASFEQLVELLPPPPQQQEELALAGAGVADWHQVVPPVIHCSSCLFLKVLHMVEIDMLNNLVYKAPCVWVWVREKQYSGSISVRICTYVYMHVCRSGCLS